jgi:hypothetical protein
VNQRERKRPSHPLEKSRRRGCIRSVFMLDFPILQRRQEPRPKRLRCSGRCETTSVCTSVMYMRSNSVGARNERFLQKNSSVYNVDPCTGSLSTKSRKRNRPVRITSQPHIEQKAIELTGNAGRRITLRRKCPQCIASNWHLAYVCIGLYRQ